MQDVLSLLDKDLYFSLSPREREGYKWNLFGLSCPLERCREGGIAKLREPGNVRVLQSCKTDGAGASVCFYSYVYVCY